MKLRHFVAAIALAPLFACSEPTAPGVSMSSVAGTYRANRTSDAGATLGALTFRTTDNGVTTDWLARGATIDLVLGANGTTTGRLVVPGLNDDGELEDGARFEADLAGTWTLTDGHITLTHAADTFLRDMDFVVAGGEIRGEETFGGVLVRVVLRRA